MHFTGGNTPAGSLSLEKRREYVRRIPWLNGLLWVVTIGSPLLGLVLSGAVGAAIGLVIG
jgi:hypothetical protein